MLWNCIGYCDKKKLVFCDLCCMYDTFLDIVFSEGKKILMENIVNHATDNASGELILTCIKKED